MINLFQKTEYNKLKEKERLREITTNIQEFPLLHCKKQYLFFVIDQSIGSYIQLCIIYYSHMKF